VAGDYLISWSGDVGGDDVCSVTVEAGPGLVVAHGGARVGVRGRLLHVAQRDSRVEGGCDERVPQGVRADRLGYSVPAGDAADDPQGPGSCDAPSPASPSNSRRPARPPLTAPDASATRPQRALPQRVSMLIRRHRSDRRKANDRAHGRPPDDVLRRGHRTPPKSSKANSHVSTHGFLGAVPPRTRPITPHCLYAGNRGVARFDPGAQRAPR
jgi:hypothetical protein